MLSVEERFWARVDKTGDCWEWTAKRDRNGYGRFNHTHKAANPRAHRFSWELHHGPVPEGLLVCHHCDNPGCVNPAHLFLGTPQDNMDDKVRKGRWRGCAPRRMSEIVRARKPRVLSTLLPRLQEITALRDAGVSLREIGEQFACDKMVIKRLLERHGLYTPQKPGPRNPHNVRTEALRASTGDILARAESGESVTSIARSYSADRHVLARIIKSHQAA
jgi:hypothetical protein